VSKECGISCGVRLIKFASAEKSPVSLPP